MVRPVCPEMLVSSLRREENRELMNFDQVRKIGRDLPDVEDGTAYGSPALKLRGKLLACIPTYKSAEANSLVVRVAFEDRAALIASEPDVYYLKDHYLDYPAVLVRLSRIRPNALKELLRMSWHFLNAGRIPARKRKSSDAHSQFPNMKLKNPSPKRSAGS